jgi:16S rRNA (cytosine1402-N4)-methyltransferase
MSYFASMHHQPVLWDEAVDALQPKPGGRYADGTFGGGGHTQLLLARSAPDGRVIAFDLDPAAIERAEALKLGDQLVLVHGSFATLSEAALAAGMLPLDGVLLDLGFSSFQIDDPARGFSLRLDGPLDMRFDTTSGPSAADLVTELDEQSLADLIWRYGEDRNSRRIASAIVRGRSQHRIETTSELAAIVERASGGARGRTHPATRTFQALRIAVNDELDTLQRALDAAVVSLAPGGRLAVISFHSLEDRIVKQFIARESATCICPPEQPVCTCATVPRLAPAGKPIKPSDEEIERNSRSRSAIMRVAERLSER